MSTEDPSEQAGRADDTVRRDGASPSDDAASPYDGLASPYDDLPSPYDDAASPYDDLTSPYDAPAPEPSPSDSVADAEADPDPTHRVTEVAQPASFGSDQEPPQQALADQFPLSDEDPVKIGDFWLDARLTATPAGMAFVGHEDRGDSVMLLLLSEGAANDPAARARFSGEINAMHIDTVVARGGVDQDEGRMAVRYRSEEDDPKLSTVQGLAPWVALAFDGSKRAVDEAARVLLAVDLSVTPPLSAPAGPDFRLHWIGKTGHGTTRLWPLPWPGRKDRAGWISMLVSFLLMALIAALALLLAILLFQNQPLVDAPQPIPSPMSGEGSGTGSAPASPSGNQSGSAQSPSGSSGGGEYSETPSMTRPSGDSSGQGDPSPNPKL